MMDDIVAVIQNLGFPALAFVMMYKMAGDTIKENTQAISRLNEAVIRLCEKEEKGGI